MTPQGLAQLKSDEGCKLNAYPDPLSGAEPWTIGYGATGDGIGPDTVWTPQQADDDLTARIAVIEAKLAAALNWWPNLAAPRQDVLTNMSYNMGVNGLLAFHRTLGAVGAGDYADAASDMLQSLWAKQLPNRSARLAAVMRDGAYPG